MSLHPSSQGLEPLAGDYRFDVQPLRTGQNKGEEGFGVGSGRGSVSQSDQRSSKCSADSRAEGERDSARVHHGLQSDVVAGSHQTSTIERNST
jgi:hypothetical protein